MPRLTNLASLANHENVKTNDDSANVMSIYFAHFLALYMYIYIL